MKSYNKVELKGRIHSYNLEEKDTEKGTAIAGAVTLEVAEDGTTVETRFFAYPHYNNGKQNRTYTMLESLMAGNYETIVEDGDEASWLAIDATIDPDYYVGRDGAKSIDDLNLSQKIRGSFINANTKHEYANTWKCDMLISRVEEIEEDEEKGQKHAARLHGYIIDSYRERLLGVRFDALDDTPINYVLGLTPSIDLPIYTAIRGEFRTVKTLVIRESAFGEDEKSERNSLHWTLVWMPRNAYEFGEDITEDEYKTYMNNLEDYKKEKLEKNNADAAADEGANLVF